MTADIVPSCSRGGRRLSIRIWTFRARRHDIKILGFSFLVPGILLYWRIDKIIAVERLWVLCGFVNVSEM